MKLVSKNKIYKDKVILALIIDGEVVENFICDGRFAAILQSNPVAVEINQDYVTKGPHIGWHYDGKDFYQPNLSNNY
jgi:hypothetical protein